jgi:hypothetical protein
MSGNWIVATAGKVEDKRAWGISFATPHHIGQINEFFGVLTGKPPQYGIVFLRGGSFGKGAEFGFHRGNRLKFEPSQDDSTLP